MRNTKRIISVLLMLSLLASCLTGCGNSEKKSFYDQVEELANCADTNIPLVEMFLGFEQDYIQDNGITDDSQSAAVASYASSLYEYALGEVAKQGTKTDHATLDKIGERADRINELTKLIGNSEYGKQNNDELRRAAASLGATHLAIMGLMIEPYGPAEQFRKDYTGLISLANQYINKIEKLLAE